MKKIIVTGATSMLGVALIKECISHYAEVVAIVRPSSDHVHRLPQSEQITIVECDLSGLEKLKEHSALQNSDIFYHFGWHGTGKSSRNQSEMQSDNIRYTLDAVDLASRCGCHTFVGAGSQAEYGRVECVISPDTSVNPEIAYGVAKYAAGKLSAISCKKLGIRCIWTRIFSVYGPNDNPDTLIMYCINELLKKRVPELTKCEQRWDYIHCDDVARAFYLIGEKGKDQAVYCIGSGKEKQLYKYIEVIGQVVDPTLEMGVGRKAYGENQVMTLCANITTLKKDTGFEPLIDFEDGIAQLVEKLKSFK